MLNIKKEVKEIMREENVFMLPFTHTITIEKIYGDRSLTPDEQYETIRRYHLELGRSLAAYYKNPQGEATAAQLLLLNLVGPPDHMDDEQLRQSMFDVFDRRLDEYFKLRRLLHSRLEDGRHGDDKAYCS